VAELLIEDREGYVPPAALAQDLAQAQAQAEAEGAEGTEAAGTLFVKGTLDAYVAAVIELWRVQVAHGNHNTENPRGVAVRGFLEQRGRQRSKLDRESFKDRGVDGIQAGYSPGE
jgi:hypothetical protein